MKEMCCEFKVYQTIEVEDEESFEKEKAEIAAKLNKEYSEAEFVSEFEI